MGRSTSQEAYIVEIMVLVVTVGVSVAVVLGEVKPTIVYTEESKCR